MAFLYDYMTESELELAKEEKEFEMESTRIMNAMTAIEMKHELDIKQIESRAMFESYTDDQLTEAYEREYLLYTEATDSVWAKFKAFIKNIVNKILGRKSGNVPADLANTEVTLDDNPGKVREIINKVAGIFKTTEGDLSILKVTIAGVGSAIGVKFLKDKLTERKAEKTKIKAGDLSTEISETEKSVKNLQESIPDDPKDGSFKSTLISLGNYVVSLGQKLINKMKDIITKITGHQFKSQEGENTDANGETNDNANASDSSKEGEKPAENGSGNNANQQNNSNGSRGNSNKPKKIHDGESQSTVSNGEYQIDWDKVTKVADVQKPLDDILSYGKKEEVLNQLSKEYFIETNSKTGNAQGLKASDITADTLGQQGIQAIIDLANANGAAGIQEWGKVPKALHEIGQYNKGKLKKRKEYEEKQSVDKGIKTKEKHKFNASWDGIVGVVLGDSKGKSTAYEDYETVRDTMKTQLPNTAKIPVDETQFNKLVSAVKGNFNDGEKKQIAEKFIKKHNDLYTKNLAEINKALTNEGLNISDIKGTEFDDYDDTLEKEMVDFANTNKINLFSKKANDSGLKPAQFRSAKNSGPGWSGDYCFDPATLSSEIRQKLLVQAANQIFNDNSGIDESIVKKHKDKFEKFGQYLLRMTKYGKNGANKTTASKSGKASLLGIKLESTYESIDFDEFENILVTESEIDMLFESTTSEIVAEINEIFESTFMSTK